MIQDILPHVFHNEYKPDSKLQADSPVLCYAEGKILIHRRADDKTPLVFPRGDQTDGTCVYAFSVDDTEYFLDIGGKKHELPDFEYIPVREARAHLPNVFGMILYTGYHLSQWYEESRYCGACAAATVHSLTERAVQCPGCGRTYYPRLLPAVIVGVTDGDRLLVTKYKTGFGYFALVAGFVEIGETLEETVAREVREETGLKVKNIRYYKSQPWGIVKDVLMGFYCDVDGDSTIRLDENELKLAEWRKAEDIELQPDNYSLTNEMMKNFKDKKGAI